MKRTMLFGLTAASFACARETPVQPASTNTEPVLQVRKNGASAYEMIDLGDLGGGRAVPLAFNDAGQVVGHSKTAEGSHAFLWENGAMRDLAAGTENSDAQVITDEGIVLGRAVFFGGPGGLDCVGAVLFRWENGLRT